MAFEEDEAKKETTFRAWSRKRQVQVQSKKETKFNGSRAWLVTSAHPTCGAEFRCRTVWILLESVLGKTS